MRCRLRWLGGYNGVLGGTLSECDFLWGAYSGHGSFHSPYPVIHMASLCRLDLDGAILGFWGG